MAALGVPTTRALSLIASRVEKAQRPWYRNASAAIAIGAHTPVRHGGDVMRDEVVAITTRVATSFLRVGQFELYGRRARRGDADGRRQLELLTRHMLRRDYPNETAAAAAEDGGGGGETAGGDGGGGGADDGNGERSADTRAPLQPLVLAMARAASRRFAHLAAEWVRAVASTRST